MFEYENEVVIATSEVQEHKKIKLKKSLLDYIHQTQEFITKGWEQYCYIN